MTAPDNDRPSKATPGDPAAVDETTPSPADAESSAPADDPEPSTPGDGTPDAKPSDAHVPPPPDRPRWLLKPRRRALRVAIRARRRTRRHMTTSRTDRASAALSATLAALLASAGWLVIIGPPTDDRAADLVSDYLEAIRDGDTDAALDIAGAEKPPKNDDFLTAETVSSDWRVDSVTTMPGSEDKTVVTVRISDTGGRWTRGEFVVSDRGLDEPRIDNPFAVVGVSDSAPGFLDLNGTVAAVVPDDDGLSPHPVFPGGYDLYPGNRSLLRVEPGRMLVLPNANVDDTQPAQSLDFGVTATAKGRDSVQKTLNAKIDECVESTELAPANCPFTAEDDLYSNTVTTDRQYFTKIEDITWKLQEHPDIELRSGEDGLRMSQRNDTSVTLDATGIPVFGDEDDKRVEFTVDCSYGIGDIVVEPTASGSFTLSMPDDDYSDGDCRLR